MKQGDSRSRSSKMGGGGTHGKSGKGSDAANKTPSRKMSSSQRNAGKLLGVDKSVRNR